MTQAYRLLHLIDHLGPGGAQEALLNLVTYADRRRFQPEVAALHGRGVYWQAFGQRQIPVYSLAVDKHLPVYVPRLMALLRQRSYHLIHCHLSAANLIGKPLAALCGVPVIFNQDQCNDAARHRHGWLLILDRLANRWCHQVIAVSASTREFLVAREGIPREKVAVVYNSVDLKRFFPPRGGERQAGRRRFGLPLEAPVVLGVGRLHPQKNFPGFLAVAQALHRRLPQVHFAIAGDGPERQALLTQIRRLGLADRVHLLGFVSPMRPLYVASDVLFLPSFYEGTPLTVLEAMACGLPVVAAAVDGTAEVITDGREGFLAGPQEHQVFVARLAAVLEDSGLARRLAAAALDLVQRRFAAEVITAQVEALYSRHLEGG